MTALTEVDWSRFKACKTCGASAGEACISTWLQTTRGNPVTISTPHSGRKFAAPPVSSVAQKERT